MSLSVKSPSLRIAPPSAPGSAAPPSLPSSTPALPPVPSCAWPFVIVRSFTVTLAPGMISSARSPSLHASITVRPGPAPSIVRFPAVPDTNSSPQLLSVGRGSGVEMQPGGAPPRKRKNSSVSGYVFAPSTIVLPPLPAVPQSPSPCPSTVAIASRSEHPVPGVSSSLVVLTVIVAAPALAETQETQHRHRQPGAPSGRTRTLETSDPAPKYMIAVHTSQRRTPRPPTFAQRPVARENCWQRTRRMRRMRARSRHTPQRPVTGA